MPTPKLRHPPRLIAVCTDGSIEYSWLSTEWKPLDWPAEMLEARADFDTDWCVYFSVLIRGLAEISREWAADSGHKYLCEVKAHCPQAIKHLWDSAAGLSGYTPAALRHGMPSWSRAKLLWETGAPHALLASWTGQSVAGLFTKAKKYLESTWAQFPTVMQGPANAMGEPHWHFLTGHCVARGQNWDLTWTRPARRILTLPE